MNSHKEPNGWLAYALIILVVASFTGWWLAESDNEILRKQANRYLHSEVCHAD